MKNRKKTSLPDNLKSGIENLSGYSLDNIKVHYNSDKPSQLQALAYAQGTDIHIASGQEQHLPHEAWHEVQQKQGRVKPTMQRKGSININDDIGLEKEDDEMGATGLNESLNKNTICEKCNVSPVVPLDNSKIGLALSTLGKTPINGLRHNPEDGTNGWYVWCGEEFSSSDDFFQPVHIEHLDNYLPQIKQYLNLPPGYRFLIDDKGYEDVWFDQNINELK